MSGRRPAAERSSGRSRSWSRHSGAGRAGSSRAGGSRVTLSSQTTSAPGAIQPPASADATARSPEAAGVGRVEEDEVERRGMVAAEAGGVAADDPGRLVGRHQADVAAEERERRLPLSTKVAKAAPRDSASRPSAPVPGEEVEHAPALGRRRVAVVAVGEQVEEALAHPVRGRPQLRRRIAGAEVGQHQPAVPAADDPHRRPRAVRHEAAIRLPLVSVRLSTGGRPRTATANAVVAPPGTAYMPADQPCRAMRGTRG